MNPLSLESLRSRLPPYRIVEYEFDTSTDQYLNQTLVIEGRNNFGVVTCNSYTKVEN